MTVELDIAAILEKIMDNEKLFFESIDLFLERVILRMTSLKKSIKTKNIDIYYAQS